MKTQLPLLPGEQPIPSAPQIVLDDGTNCIPQHYLSYQHTVESVSNIVAEIDYSPHYVLFVDDDNSGIFIQVGIVGLDNYVALHKQESQKIVYGRRWRVEPNLPSSEIIQTAFLALCKAREHEVRELFKWRNANHTSTPFSCHHDLPLMAMSSATETERKSPLKYDLDDIQALLASLSYDGAQFNLNNMHAIDDENTALTISVKPNESTRLPELLPHKTLVLLLECLHQDALLYALMDKLIAMSNRHVEEHFTFKGYSRFSRNNSIEKIAALSAKTRKRESNDALDAFSAVFSSMNYETDSTRVPKIRKGVLGEKIQSQLNVLSIGSGILPKSI